MPIAPGENVGPYRVLEQLGSGGMATVFKSYHAALDRYVAIKILHPAFKADPQFFERFKREARIVAKLEHPNIIPVYDFNEHHGEPYLVMRFVEGDTLKPRMQGHPMPPNEVLRLMRPVCEALAYAHAQGVLHRDIKPSNIMVTKEGNVFVTDFGLARMVEAGESTLSQDMMVGTPQYISPEQAQGMRNLDGRTDIYSLGVVLYEMLTGRVPFSADTPFATIHDHIYTPLPPPSSLNPNIDPAVERMLLKALSKDPNDRYATATDLLQALEKALGGQIAATPTIARPAAVETVLAPTPAAKSQKKGLPWWVWVGAVVLVLVLLAGIWVGLRAWQRAKLAAQLQPTPAQIGQGQEPVLPPAGEPSQPGNPPLAGEPGQPSNPPPVSEPGQPGNPPAGEPSQPGNPPPAGEPGQPGNPPLQPGEEPGQPGNPPPPPGVDPNNPAYKEAAKISQKALEAMRQDKVDQAIELFRQAIQTMPQYLPAYFGLSDALNRQGDQAGSLAVLQEAVDKNPQDPAAYLRLGNENLQNEKPEAALQNFTKAAELMPNEAMPYAGQAMAWIAMGKLDEAKSALDKALILNPLNAEARLANALYLFKQGDKLKAVQELRNLMQDQRAPNSIRERARQWLDRLKP
jgi:Flp pilus assembly protein TadD/predicted Ser/Thr protein kinase